MPDLQTEIEYKFAANHIVDVSSFLKWALGKAPLTYESVSFPDVYYVRGNDSVRHRWNGGAGELTVKQRTSQSSIMNRKEVDLFFDPTRTTINDVTTFLALTGWKRLFTLFKDEAHVFKFALPQGGALFLCIYVVVKHDEKTGKDAQRRQFIEIEIEKGSKYDAATSKRILDAWKKELQEIFGLGAPVNSSLFEIYSGKTSKRFATY